MAKFKVSVNLSDAVRQLEAYAKVRGITLGKEFFVVVDTFDFGRDVNGNTINRYRATLHCSDLVSVENGYSNCGSIPVLTSPYRREQSDGSFFGSSAGQSMALYWLEKIGYDLAYESMQDTTPNGKNRAYRHVYRVTNNYLKAV
ncbi:hypothetical protein I4U30_22925 [Enterobacter asburiae]|uniref:hypothetical protein n=1 Tax=Enterobacter asburiae TaxID=61645 RepID=UPI00192C4E58|nr:hypothetical protein [Enterobacter asburiae]MBL5841120.1 hypothetical protein [Enterobacter asburiae]